MRSTYFLGLDRRTALLGAAGLGALLGLGWTTMIAQGKRVRRTVEHGAIAAALAAGIIDDGAIDPGSIPPPLADGIYGDDDIRQPVELAVLGDSTSVGYGVVRPRDVPGAVLAPRLAGAIGRTVRLRSYGVVGALSADLEYQADRALATVQPDLVFIAIGANDVVNTTPVLRAANQLASAVTRFRQLGIGVVVATCPDFAVITPIPHPLKAMVTALSRTLAVAQGRAASAAGARVVHMWRDVSPKFAGRKDCFFGDGFHPSAKGYRIAVDAITPVAIEVLREGHQVASAQ